MIAYVRRMGWIVFWVAVVILGLLVVPVMNNTSAIPTVVFAIIVLAIFSGLWGTGMLGRRLAMSSAAIALTLSLLSFFLPKTAQVVPKKIAALDTWIATPTSATPAVQQYAAANTPATPSGDQVTQLPDHHTPCKMKIKEIRDLYTDGEAIYALPPGWNRKDAVFYSGRGHLILEGGNIHSGEWEFWSADDPTKVVLIRVIGK